MEHTARGLLLLLLWWIAAAAVEARRWLLQKEGEAVVSLSVFWTSDEYTCTSASVRCRGFWTLQVPSQLPATL